MNMQPDCIPCLLRQALRGAKLVTDDQSIHNKVLKEIMKYFLDLPAFLIPPGEITSIIQEKLRQIINHDDPYRQVKQEFNQLGLELYPELKGMVKGSDDPLLTTSKLAIAGNVIDFGAGYEIIELEETIERVLKEPLARDDYPLFKEVVARSKDILYLADNAGEIVFDRILIEELIREGKKVTLVVKAAPVINDVTLEDAKFVGLDKIVPIILSPALIGTPLDRCPDDFRQIFYKSKLIISKGQGNFETLFEEEEANIFFLFQTKCHVVARMLAVKFGQALLMEII